MESVTRVRGMRTLRVLIAWIAFAIGLPVALAFGLGWAFSLSAPGATSDNASPPPEGILFIAGAAIGLIVGLVFVIWFMASWRRLRHRLSKYQAKRR
jgi:hypothetical protein